MCGLLENTPLDPTQLDYVKTAQASGSKSSTESSLQRGVCWVWLFQTSTCADASTYIKNGALF
jgi:hypothetical protein